MAELKKLSKPHESLQLIRVIMGITGGLPPLDNPKWDKLYLIFSLFMVIVFGVLFVLSQFINLFSITDIEVLADSSYLMFEQLSFCIKAFIVIKNWKLIRKIYKKLQSSIFSSHSYDQDYIVQESIWIVRRNSRGYYLMISVGVIIIINAPLAFGSTELPCPGWFPFDTTTSTVNFVLVYMWQELGLAVCANLNGSIDMLSTGLMILACGQLNVLSNSLENIRQKAINRLQNKELFYPDNNILGFTSSKIYAQNNSNVNRTGSSEEFNMLKHATFKRSDKLNKILEDAIYTEVVNCVRHHHEIFSLLEMIASTFQNMVFVQFIGSVLVLCVTTFELSLMSFGNPNLFGVIIYQIIMLQQLFLYCWYGNEVFYSSLNVFDAAYMSKWNKSGTKIRQAIAIIMDRARRPVLLKAGNFLSLRLHTFISILRLSYSFYTLLQQAHNDKE